MNIFYQPQWFYPNDLSIRSHHHKTCYCVIKDNHVYTCNVNLNELQQKFKIKVDKNIEELQEKGYWLSVSNKFLHMMKKK